MFKTCTKASGGEEQRGYEKEGEKIISECRLIFHIEALGHLTKQCWRRKQRRADLHLQTDASLPVM